MEAQELFTEDVFNNPLAVSGEQADQWVEYLLEAIAEKIPEATGYGNTFIQASSQFPYSHREIKVNGTNGAEVDLPRIKIVPLGKDNETTGLYIFLASLKPITEDEIATLKEAMEKAAHRLDEESPEFQWAAALGQMNHPTTVSHALRKKAPIGSVIIRSGGQQHTTYEQNAVPHFSGMSFAVTWPVVVEGTAKGYNWFVASREAGKDTHLVAALLSLAWGTTWRLLQSPQPIAPGSLKIPPSSIIGRPPVRIPHPKKYKVVPKWIEKAVPALEADPRLSNALNAYYQGLLMSQGHPSFALIAFVASIETVGRTIIGDKCTCCGKPNSSNQKFKAGLQEVVKDQAEVKRLLEAYGDRSETAHEGILHGTETALGSLIFPSVFSTSEADFALFDLSRVRSISRKLLVKALKGQIKIKKVHRSQGV